MTTDLCGEDVIVRLSSPQIISTETIVTGNAPAPQTHSQPGARAAAAGMEFGRRLLLAARAGDCNTVLELMAKGAPFTTDWLGTSPLHLSAANNHVETCAVLLRAGVCCDSRTKVERTPLHLAAHAGHTNVVSLLLQHGAMVDCRDMLRMTPLHWAAARGHLAVTRELLRHGADPRARCKFRKTPRCLAARHQRLDVLALLEAAALQEQMADETPKVLQEFDSIQKIEVVKPTEKEPSPPEKTIIIESKTEPIPISINAANVGARVGVGAARARRTDTDTESGAALLRAHGITLLPADKGSTLLTALRSGRTVVLSDAGKLLLKESSNTRLSEPLIVDTQTEATGESPIMTTSSPITVNHASGSVNINRNVVVRARAVRSVRGAKNVKLVTLNKPDQTFKKVINPSDLQQVKLLQVSPADRDNKNTVTRPRPALKLLLNKTNLTRLLASNANTPTPIQQVPLTLSAIQQPQDISTDSLMDTTEPTQDITMEENDNIVRIPEQFVKSSSIKYLRSQLLTAHAAIANLTTELRLCKAKLAKYENQQ